MMCTALQHYFTANMPLVLFVYGLSFFGIGIAILSTHVARRYKPLQLDRGMPWLAAFGFVHGLHEWGEMFIPLQATYTPSSIIHALNVVLVLSLALSFACLLQFGLILLTSSESPWRHLSFALLTGWTLLAFWRTVLPPSWVTTASIWARYFLGFPAGLAGGAGLYRYFRQRAHILPRNVASSLKIAAGALAAYSFLGGLVVEPGSFFPANVLNADLFIRTLGIPIYTFRAVDGLILAGAVINAMKVFDLEIERRLEQMKIQQNILSERERIAREIHDNTIQTIYAAGMLLESLAFQLGPEDEIARQLTKAVRSLNEAIDNLRSFVDGLRPLTTTQDLEQGIQKQIEELNLEALLNVHLDFALPAHLQCNPNRIAHILAIVREALSNTARHAHARHVSIHVRADEAHRQLVLTVKDDGRGFAPQQVERGYGLRNMYDRAHLLGGQLTLETAPGQGTTVILRAPLEKAR